MIETVIQSCYFVSSFLFVLSLGGLSHPESSRKGNCYGMFGMTLAIAITFFTLSFGTNDFIKFFSGFIPGGIIGLALALRVNFNKLKIN